MFAACCYVPQDNIKIETLSRSETKEAETEMCLLRIGGVAIYCSLPGLVYVHLQGLKVIRLGQFVAFGLCKHIVCHDGAADLL